jgi:Flp pilus assembly pilin Flp
MIRTLRSLLGEDRGTAAIELAIIAPMLATLVVGVVDLSNGFSRKLALEQATQRAIEKVMQTTDTLPVEDVIKAEASAAAGIPIANVTVTYRLECNEVAKPSYDDECTSGQRESRYLMVTATDKYTPMFAASIAGANADGTYHLSATSGLRTPACDSC